MDSTTPRGLPPAWADFLRAERVRLERLGLRRSVVTPERRGGVHATLGGREYVAFTSNDYLGLASRPEVIDAANAAASRYGTGARSARLLHGSTPAHEALEERLAAWTGQPAALLFSSGYMANLGVIGALAGGGDVVFYDERAHASIIDGAKLSGAQRSPIRTTTPNGWTICFAGRRRGAVWWRRRAYLAWTATSRRWRR